jgi:hypothetical protein
MLPIYVSQKELSIGDLLKLPSFKIQNGWLSEQDSQPPEFTLAVTTQNLLFSFNANYKPWHNSEKQGSFVSGLWNYDVAEIFLKDDYSESYQEFNLSPSGAWWTQCFESYRKPSAQKNNQVQIQTFSEINKDNWEVGIIIPKNILGIKCSFSENSKANICAILGQNFRNYFSYNSVISEKPDFHHQDNFRQFDYLRGKD